MRHGLSRGVVIGVSALALCGVGAGVALASSSADVPDVSTVAAAGHHGGHGKRGERGEHGEFTGAGKAHRTVDYQRGAVTAVAGGSITVRSADGFTQTYTVGPTTKVRRDRQASTAAAVVAGDRVFVVASKEPSGLQALRVRDRGPAPASSPAPSTPTTPN